MFQEVRALLDVRHEPECAFMIAVVTAPSHFSDRGKDVPGRSHTVFVSARGVPELALVVEPLSSGSVDKPYPRSVSLAFLSALSNFRSTSSRSRTALALYKSHVCFGPIDIGAGLPGLKGWRRVQVLDHLTGQA